jgi:ABC-type nitrate/sulfonate/bicarbonate transport system substrate-binding protein
MNKKTFAPIGVCILALAACGGQAAPTSTAASSVAAGAPSSAAATSAKPAASGAATSAKPAASGASAPAKPAVSGAAAAKPSVSANAAAKPAASGGVTVKLATNPISPSNGFVWVGQEQGIFAKDGVNVEVDGLNGQVRSQALLSGQVDAEVGGGPQEFVAARAQNAPLTIIAAFSNRFDDVLLVSKDITAPEQLKGKTIGAVTTTSVDAQGAVEYFHEHGMELNRDYKLIGVGAATSQAGPAAAMAAHQVDAALLQEDFARGVVQAGGGRVLVDLATDTDLILPGVPINVRQDLIQKSPDSVQKMLDGLIDSVRYTKEHPAETKASWMKRYKIDDAARMDLIYQREMELWTTDPKVDKAALQEVINFMSISTPAAKNLDPASLIDTRFVEDAEKRGITKAS